jgi:hypothetical protein
LSYKWGGSISTPEYYFYYVWTWLSCCKSSQILYKNILLPEIEIGQHIVEKQLNENKYF